MGAYTSTRIITKQEAADLLGPTACRRVEEGMRRLAPLLSVGSSGTGPGAKAPPNLPIDRKTFQRFVLDAYPNMVSPCTPRSCATPVHARLHRSDAC
jgi:hypothetical protein